MDHKRLEKIDWLKWRWEFMRRNKEYKKDYNCVLKLRKNPRSNGIKYNDYGNTQEGIKEKEYCRKWCLGFNQMMNPNLSFEDLFKNDPGFFEREIDETEDWMKGTERVVQNIMVESALDPRAVEVLRIYNFKPGQIALNRKIKPNDFLLRIDFSKINSLKSCKKYVSELIESYFKQSKHQISERKETEFLGEKAYLLEFAKEPERSNRQRYMVDYALILQVGDMKEKQNMTNEQIAKTLYPRDFDINNENAKPESKTRTVGHIYKSYKQLVDGSYKNISFP